jgi:hypothetical protein
MFYASFASNPENVKDFPNKQFSRKKVSDFPLEEKIYPYNLRLETYERDLQKRVCLQNSQSEENE